MNHIIAKECFIPLQVKLEIMEELYPLAEAGNNDAFKKLFMIYKQYVSESPKDDYWDCDGCRLKAFRHMKQIVNHWKFTK